MELIGVNEARKIMNSFIGPEEANKHWRTVPLLEHAIVLSNTLFPEDLLVRLSESHILVVVPPAISICAMWDVAYLRSGRNIFARQYWYRKQNFAWSNGDEVWTWWFVRKSSVPDSFNKTWHKQKALLGNVEEVPSARILTYAIITHFLATGERLLKDVFVRTVSPVLSNRRVRVGFFGEEEGFSIGYCPDHVFSGRLGISSAISYTFFRHC